MNCSNKQRYLSSSAHSSFFTVKSESSKYSPSSSSSRIMAMRPFRLSRISSVLLGFCTSSSSLLLHFCFRSFRFLARTTSMLSRVSFRTRSDTSAVELSFLLVMTIDRRPLLVRSARSVITMDSALSGSAMSATKRQANFRSE